MVEERLSAKWLEQNKETLSYRLHIERYLSAAAQIDGGDTLDIACGVGYGTAILSESCNPVGVDIDKEAIAQATQNYPHLTFHLASYESYTPTTLLDTIVSLETIEHLPAPESFISFCYHNLKKGGRLIISAPVSYTTDLNSFHLHDFTQKSFDQLITKQGFIQKEVLLRQTQPMLSTENAQKLSTKEWLSLVWSYITHPKRIALRMLDLVRNGLHIKYVLIMYEK